MFGSFEGWNSPYINHFLSADTIVPNFTNPQTLNRYSYVLNNPLKYTDPTGHKETACASQNDPDCAAVNGGSTGNAHSGGTPHLKHDEEHGTTVAEDILCPGDCFTLSQGITTSITSTDYSYKSLREIQKLLAYIRFMNNAIGLVKDLATASRLLEKGFLWGKAISPDPRLDFILGAAGQGIGDWGNSELTIGQRVARAGIVGLESMGTGVVSDLAGAGGFVLGELVVPEGGGAVGYAVAAAATSIYLDEVAWNSYNQDKFEGWGLGAP